MGLLDRPQQAQRFGLLSPDVMQLIQSGGPRVAPAPVAPATPARRERVSGWRVLDRVLGGETVSEGLDAERARLQAEAMRPQNEARAAFVRAHAMALGPVAEAALALNPEEYGRAMSSNLEGYTLGAGGVRGGVNGQVATAPTFTTVNDTIYRNDPGRGVSIPTATAPAAFSDVTARYNAENPTVASGATVFNLPTGRVVARGTVPLSPVSVPQGGSVAPFNTTTGEFGAPMQGNPDAPPNNGRNGPGNFDATTRGALSSASQAASLARSRASDARRFIELNRANPTGLGAAMLGPAAALNPAYAEMRAISARLVPGERTPGSGPMSDGDAILFGRAVLDIDKPGPTNQALADVVIASAERDADYASFLDEYANLNGNLIGANEDWQAYVNANPLFAAGANGQTTRRPARSIQPWREFMGFGERQRGGSQSRAGGNQPAPAAPPRVAYDAQGRRYVVRNGQWVAE